MHVCTLMCQRRAAFNITVSSHQFSLQRFGDETDVVDREKESRERVECVSCCVVCVLLLKNENESPDFYVQNARNRNSSK